MLADDIAAALSARGGVTPAELAERLATSERAVSLALVAAHGRFRTDHGSPGQ